MSSLDYQKIVETKRINLEMEMNILEIYERVMENLDNSMKWDTWEYHTADDEHDNTWFTEPDKDDFKYPKYQAYKMFMNKLTEVFVEKKGK